MHEAGAGTKVYIMLQDIPRLQWSQRNEARRFVTLLDTLYDMRCLLQCSAAGKPNQVSVTMYAFCMLLTCCAPGVCNALLVSATLFVHSQSLLSRYTSTQTKLPAIMSGCCLLGQDRRATVS